MFDHGRSATTDDLVVASDPATAHALARSKFEALRATYAERLQRIASAVEQAVAGAGARSDEAAQVLASSDATATFVPERAAEILRDAIQREQSSHTQQVLFRLATREAEAARLADVLRVERGSAAIAAERSSRAEIRLEELETERDRLRERLSQSRAAAAELAAASQHERTELDRARDELAQMHRARAEADGRAEAMQERASDERVGRAQASTQVEALERRVREQEDLAQQRQSALRDVGARFTQAVAAAQQLRERMR